LSAFIRLEDKEDGQIGEDEEDDEDEEICDESWHLGFIQQLKGKL
jgi:hypothetical protein